MEKHPECIFLAQMAVFKPGNQTSKCRVLYLSNLIASDPEKSPTLGHNQTMLSAPCLNRKIITAEIQLRFDKKLIVYDLVKTF